MQKRKQHKILDARGRLIVRVERIGDRVMVYDKINRRVGWLSRAGTFNELGRLLSRTPEIGLLIEIAKTRNEARR
jgi:hypothetical protein